MFADKGTGNTKARRPRHTQAGQSAPLAVSLSLKQAWPPGGAAEPGGSPLSRRRGGSRATQTQVLGSEHSLPSGSACSALRAGDTAKKREMSSLPSRSSRSNGQDG